MRIAARLSRRGPSRSGRRSVAARGIRSVSYGHDAQNGTTASQSSFSTTTRGPPRLLVDVVEEQRPAVGGEMARAGVRSSRAASCGQRGAGPDLAVRMRVRRAHHLAPVLEHLDPLVRSRRARRSGRPTGRRPAGRRAGPSPRAEVVAPGEADDPARPGSHLRPEQPVLEGQRSRRRAGARRSRS